MILSKSFFIWTSNKMVGMNLEDIFYKEYIYSNFGI